MAGLPRVEVERVDKAKAALSAFRSLQPTLTAYAQMLTGKPNVKVVAAAQDNGSTDGDNIYYRPPIELGERTQHERWNCDKRDDSGHLLCAACAQRENVLSTIYHEIAHIWFNSFDEVNDKHRSLALVESVKLFGDAYAKAIAKKIEEMPGWLRGSYMALAGTVSEFLPTIVNALEDARVNRELFRALPGTKVMFDSSTVRVFQEGVEQQDPRTGEWIKLKWSEYRLNAQIITAIFCAASGYEYKDWFHPKVIESMADEELSALVAKCDLTHSMGEVYSLSFPILHRLRELGYCISESDPLPPVPSEEKGDPGDEERESGESPEGTSPDGTGEVDREEAEGSAEADSPSGGDAGREGGRPDVDDTGSGDRDADDSPGDDALAEDDRRAPEAGDSSAEDGADSGDDAATAGESEEASHSGTGDVGGDSTHLRDGGDVSDDEVGDDPGEAARPADGGESGSHPEDDDDDGLVDTGSFDRGTRVVTDGDYVPPPPEPPMGSSEDVKVAVHKMGDHEERPYTTEMKLEKEKDAAAMKVAIVQGVYFEMPSVEVYGVTEFKYPQGGAWAGRTAQATRRLGVAGSFDVPESVLSPALLKARVVFADNMRAKYERGLKSGKVSNRHLGRRAPVGDERLMQRKIQPGKKSYFVEIGIDVSGSTMGTNITLAKQVAMAEAELLNRLGVAFAVYAHSGGTAPEARSMYQLHMYEIKAAEEPWTETTRGRLRAIGPDQANLDGHTLEFYRKKLDARRETNRILHYYSDGAMPCENHAEELAIVKREILACRRKRYTLIAVGIRTNAPAQHGLETVRVDAQADIVKVVEHLQRYLIQ